jgi:hypothetical protein
LFSALTAWVGGNISLIAYPATISFLGSGNIEPVKNIRIKRGKLPTIITVVAFLQKETRMRQTAMIDKIVREHTSNTRRAEP